VASSVGRHATPGRPRAERDAGGERMAAGLVTVGCVAAAIVALLPWRRALIAGAVALLALALLAARTPGVPATSPLLVACAFLIVALLRRLWQERGQALRLLEAERDARLAER